MRLSSIYGLHGDDAKQVRTCRGSSTNLGPSPSVGAHGLAWAGLFAGARELAWVMVSLQEIEY